MAGCSEYQELSDPIKGKKYFYQQVTIGFQKKTLLHGVS
jgi:hypothetical protein